MKRYILITVSILLCASMPIAAQDDGGDDGGGEALSFTSKNGHEVLPQEGEFSMGVSMTALFGFFNYPNFPFGLNTDQSTYGNVPPTIEGKYMLDSKTALRGRLQLNHNAVTDQRIVMKDTLSFDPLSPEFVEDEMTTTSTQILIGAGYEMRRGNSRVQGYYGGELLLGYYKTVVDYEYGNEMNTDFDTPNIANFGTGNTYTNGQRLIEDDLGSRFLVGARAFAGVEFFIAPKLSLGGEFGYALGFTTRGEREQTREHFNSGSMEVETVTTRMTPTNSLSSYGIGFDNFNGNVSFRFYF